MSVPKIGAIARWQLDSTQDFPRGTQVKTEKVLGHDMRLGDGDNRKKMRKETSSTENKPDPRKE